MIGNKWIALVNNYLMCVVSTLMVEACTVGTTRDTNTFADRKCWKKAVSAHQNAEYFFSSNKMIAKETTQCASSAGFLEKTSI